MTTIVKTRKPVAQRSKSIAAAMGENFRNFRFNSDNRSITIARTPSAFIRHGDNWTTLAKQQVADIAKAQNLTIASWEETNTNGMAGLKVYFTTTIAAFRDVLAGDVYADLLHHPENGKTFSVVSVTSPNGDEDRGTLKVSYDISKPNWKNSRQELRGILKEIMADKDKRILGVSPEEKGRTDSTVSFNLTYRNVPVLTD